MKKMAVYLLCACMVQPMAVQADTTAEAVQENVDVEADANLDESLLMGTSEDETQESEEAAQYELDLIHQAEANGEEGLVYATLDDTETQESEDAAQYELDLIHQAEADGEEGLIYATLDDTEAQASKEAAQYELDLIHQAEADGEEGLIYATQDDTEAKASEEAAQDGAEAETDTTADNTETEVIANLDTEKKVPSKKTVTLYSSKDRCWVGTAKQIKNKNVLCVVKGTVTNLKSKNSAVAKLLTSTSRGYTTVYVKPVKEGTAVVSFKQGSKTYKTKITVKKYVNPVQQVKIGTTVQNGSAFASRSILKVSCGQNLGKKTPVTISLSNGWTLSSMTYTQKGAQVGVSMKNGDSIMLQKGLVVTAAVKNKTLKQTEEITVRFN